MLAVSATFQVTGNATHWTIYIAPADVTLETAETSLTCDLPQGSLQWVTFIVQGAPGQAMTLSGTSAGRQLFPPKKVAAGSKQNGHLDFEFKA
jgi:hypothetical protein